jgi:hypothetical protein
MYLGSVEFGKEGTCRGVGRLPDPHRSGRYSPKRISQLRRRMWLRARSHPSAPACIHAVRSLSTPSAACAAASRATGTRYGLHET